MTVSFTALTSSSSIEWYTPPEIVGLVRDVLGDIDLDPASCATANATVQARFFYTMGDDGLRQQWQGRVFCNPPYGGVQRSWIEKLTSEHVNGNIDEAILLVKAATDCKWFRPLWQYPICFVSKRLQFVSPDGARSRNPHGSVLVYFGERPERFDEVFSMVGRVVHPPKSSGGQP